LWLDKYRPTRFVDLLSDERTNREVLTWLKKWDTFVFPHKRPNKPTRKDSKEMEDLRPIEKVF
jgi:chromosome transmission fidelity protein 18